MEQNKKIHLVGFPRSGSTYTFEYISMHMPLNSVCHGEPFNNIYHHYEHRDQEFLRHSNDILDQLDNAKDWLVKSHIRHIRYLHDLDSTTYNRLFDPKVFWIRLLRKDIIASAMSFCVAKCKRRWYYNSTAVDPEYTAPIYLNHDFFITNLRYCVGFFNELAYNPMRIPFKMDLFFEDGPDNVLQKYFGCQDKLEIKSKPSPLKQNIVKNYDELRVLGARYINQAFANDARIKINSGVISHVDLSNTH